MEPVIIMISLCATVFGIAYYYLFARNKERLALIQSGADASLFKAPPRKGPNWTYSISLIIGFMAMGIGLGVFLATIVEQGMINQQLQMVKQGLLQEAQMEFPQAYVTGIFFFGGAGLVAAFYQLKHMYKKENV
jgi:hypothetical protein